MIRNFSILLVICVGFAQDKGKNAYEDGNYDEARNYYENVLKNRQKDDAAQFGLGATAYQQQDMATAARSLNSVMSSDDKSLASKAMYNLGNMFRDQQKMEESLALYKKAIELDPTDEDAKVNYEMLKQVVQQQQEQQQQQNKDQEKDQDSDKDQDKEQNQQSQSEQEKQQQEQQQSQAKKEEFQEQKTDKQMQAEAILDALKDQEKINQKRQIAKAKSRKLEKDW